MKNNRTVFAFLAGFAACAVALYAAGTHGPAVFFTTGALASTAASMALRWAVNRKTRHRRVRFVRVSPQARPAQKVPQAEAATDSRRKCEPGTFKNTSAAPPSQIEADVASALKNFGASKTQAAELARQAITGAGAGANFQAIMRLALRQSIARGKCGRSVVCDQGEA